uniref:two-partner secretion domain-containing protein n=1 Tax=Stenoxybacter acetivorans TaxID=422441 RepID=UPI000690B7A9
DSKGAVLNNQRGSNPYLNHGTAKLILNEVRSSKPSSINGVVAVQGNRADVVIANPSGISVNGGGFSNVGRGVLTTGIPQFKDGNLSGLQVKSGNISVGKNGWDGRGAVFTDVISRSVQLHGALRANQLSVSAGAANVDYRNGQITAAAAAKPPSVGIDVAQLGGMYANSITLMTNEKGVGVKNAGTLQAARQLVVSAEGKLENTGTIRTTAAATETAPTYLRLATADHLQHTGKIEANGMILLEASKDITSSPKAVIRQNNDKHTAAVLLDAGGNLNLSSGSTLHNKNGSISAAAGKNFTLSGTINTDTGGIRLASQQNLNSKQAALTAKQDISLLSNAFIYLQDGNTLNSGGNLHLEAAQPTPTGNQTGIHLSENTLTAAGSITVLTDGYINSHSTLKAGKDLSVQSGQELDFFVGGSQAVQANNINLYGKTVNLSQGIRSQAMKQARPTLSARQNINIQAGQINTAKLDLNAASGSMNLTADKGKIQLDSNTRLNAKQNINISNLSTAAIDAASLNAAAANGKVSILGGGDVRLRGNNQISANTGVNIGSVGVGSLNTDQLTAAARAGDVQLTGKKSITAGNISLSGNQVYLSAKGGYITLNKARLTANKGNIALEAKNAISLSNSQSQSSHNTVIAAEQGAVTLNQVNASAGKHLAISSRSSQVLSNHQQNSLNNQFTANGVLSIHSSGNQVLNNTRIQGGAVTLKSNKGNLGLYGSSSAGSHQHDVLGKDTQLKNINGNLSIESGGDTIIAAGHKLTADKDLDIRANKTVKLLGVNGNQGRTSSKIVDIEAKGDTRLVGGSVLLQGSRIISRGNLSIAATNGNIIIQAVNSNSTNRKPLDTIYTIKRDRDLLAMRIQEIAAKNPKDKRLAALRAEQVRYDFYLQRLNGQTNGNEHRTAYLSGGKNTTVFAKQGIQITGAELVAKEKLILEAAGLLPEVKGEKRHAIEIDSVTDTHEIGKPNHDSYDYAQLNIPSRLLGRQGVSIRAAAQSNQANLSINGSHVYAIDGNIDISAYSDVLLGSAENEGYYKRHSTKTECKKVLGIKVKCKTTEKTDQEQHTAPAPVWLNAGKNISITAGSNLTAEATQFYASNGKVSLTAGDQLSLIAVDAQHYKHRETKKKSSFIGITVNKSGGSKSILNQSKLPTKVIAKTANTQSGWHTLLEGTEFHTSLKGANIQAGVGPKARKDAKIILQGIVKRVSTEEKRQSSSAVWQTQAGSGSVVETLTLPQFNGPTQPKLTAPGGYIVEIPKGKLKTEIEKLAKTPEHAYLKQLQVANNVQWQQVNLEYQKWNYQQSGLTGAGAAVIALAVAVATAGAGAPIAAGAVGSAMQTAAISSLATQASISLINNKGNIGKTLKELGSSKTAKNLAVAVITAGVAEKVGGNAALNNISNNATLNQFTVNLTNSVSGAIISTAISGGSGEEALKQAILSALVQSVHGEIASQIKGTFSDQYIAHKIAHAVAGCAAAAANKEKCRDGAIGAAVAEIWADANQPANGYYYTDTERKKLIAESKLVAGTVTAAMGGNVNTAANAAHTAVINNGVKDKLDELMKLAKENKQLQKAIEGVDTALRKGDVEALKRIQGKIRVYLAQKGTAHGSDLELHVLASLHVINEVLLPTNVIDATGPIGKGIKKTVTVLKATEVANVTGKATAYSRMPVPVPTPTVTKSGEKLTYQSSSKHTPGEQGFNSKAGIEPRNSFELFKESKVITGDVKARYAQDAEGNIHRFSITQGNQYHWSGWTGDKSNKLTLKPEVKKEFDLKMKGKS